MSSNYKYSINEQLQRLPIKKYRQALQILPIELGISVGTFNNYKAIKIGDPQDIPYTVVVKLEQFFGLEKGDLQNFDTNVKAITDRPDVTKADIAADFNLTR